MYIDSDLGVSLMAAYISEVLSKERVSEIPIHLYVFSVEDQNKRFEGFATYFYQIRRMNNYQIMSYNQWTIASFEPIQFFDEKLPKFTNVCRPIDPSNLLVALCYPS